METDDLIDNVLAYTDNVSAIDGDNATRRLRYLLYTQQVVDEVWNQRDWAFKYKRGTLAVSASGTDLPADFQEFGNQGGVYDANGRMLHEISPQEANVVNESGISSSVPDSFMVIGQNAGAKQIRLSAPPGGSVTLTLWYIKTSPVLTDGSDGGLLEIPVAYHHTVLLPGVVARSRKNKGDSRDWFVDYQRGLAYMVARERSLRTTTQRLPLATGNW